MTDIDFDELDRAVSSLMDQHNKPADTAMPPQADTQPPVDTAPLSSDAAQSSMATPGPVAEPASMPDVAPTATATVSSESAVAPIVQRRGRFMDVIPSHNPRVVAPDRSVPSERPSREAAAIQPDAPAPEKPMDASLPTSTSTVDNPTPQSNQDLETNPVDALELPELAPLESPFIEGIEVDKRPLGSSSSTDSREQLEAVSANISSDDTAMPDPMTFGAYQQIETVTEPEPSVGDQPSLESMDPWTTEAREDSPAPEEPLRPELSPEVLAVESSEILTEPQSVPTASPRQTTPLESVEQPGLPGNINPQYTTAPADTPEPSGIFEAAADTPQPLAHPEKKKSGWMVMVWILLLVVIGAAGGVAAWYFLLR